MLWIPLAIIGAAVLFFVILYNGLVAKKNQVSNVFGTIDALLKKRYDLIPNLVATVKQYMQHEHDTLTEIADLRARGVAGNLPDADKVQLENRLSRMLGGILVAVENYPQLKADENFRQLQGSLNEVEEQISAARRAYNAAVTDYNNALEMFPTNVVASMLNYQRRALFEIPPAERQNVNVGKLFQS